MDEDLKKQIALFRFGVIHDLINLKEMEKGRKEQGIREKSARMWDIPGSGRSYISRSTILNWIRTYKNSGRKLEGLYPKERKDKGDIKAIDDDTAQALINLKKEYPNASVSIILRLAKRRQIAPKDFKASRATIYRLFEKAGLFEDTVNLKDRRKFEAEFPNDIWQSDCMHGPKADVNGKLRKTYLFAFLDDMSRIIPHAEFYLSERIDSYTNALIKALKKRGMPQKLYVDNGSAFRSHQLSYGCASLGIALIHSRPYQPQGRGKIERWFKTVRGQFLSVCPEGLTLRELNIKITEWIEKDYHIRKHSGIFELPIKRYLKHIHLIKEAPAKLTDYFRNQAVRTVGRDRTVSLSGKLYEAPIELTGKRTTLFFHKDDPARVEIFYKNISYGMIVPVDINVNCRVRRLHGITEIIDKNILSDKNILKQNQTADYSTGRLFNKMEDK